MHEEQELHHQQRDAVELPVQEQQGRAGQQPRPRIYVASLSDFNVGRLHGSWIDADAADDELHEQIQAMLARSPEPSAEEYAVHDYEGFAGIRLGEYESIETVARIGRALVAHGPAFAGLVELLGIEDATEEAFDDRYLGAWESVEAYAEDLLDSTGIEDVLAREVPEGLRPYVRVDVAGLARDMQLGGDISVWEGDDAVHLFSTY